MLRIENTAQSDKLPIEHPLPEVINIYAKRLGIFFAIVVVNFLVLGLFLGARFLPQSPSLPPYVLMIAVVLLLFIGTQITVYSLAVRTNKVVGHLTFIDGNVSIAEFGLYRKVVPSKQLRYYPQLGIKKIKVSKSVPKSDAIDIHITYYNGEKEQKTLSPNSPAMLTSGFIVIYETPN